MIVPMKKITVIVQSKDAGPAVKALRSLGAVHVENRNPPGGQDIISLRDEIALIDSAIGVLASPEFSSKPHLENGRRVKDWQTAARHVVGLWKRLDQLEEYSRILNNRIKEWERWGDFDPEAIRALEAKNIYARLYEIPVKHLKDIPAGLVVKNLFTSAGVAHSVVISRERIEIPFKEVEPPKTSLGDMRSRLSEDERTMQAIKNNIIRHRIYCETFSRIKKAFENELEFHEALRGMGSSGTLAYLGGYVPFDAADKLAKKSREERWGILITDPSEDDIVPTLIRNPKWVSIIEPVFKAMGIIPGYHELDISLWFLLFLSIFFGMLIGDAGYGIIFFTLTCLVQRRMGKAIKDKSPFILFYVMSLFAVAWGVLTGTFFGQAWLPQSVRPLMPALRDDRNIQSLCFFLGALHLSIAHIWRFVLKAPSLEALADMGWAVILWGGFFLAKTLILGDAFPAFGKWLFIAGSLLVIFFTRPNKNVLKGLGSGLGALLLNFVNSFTDVVSYIRLFAVGLATVAIADAFNQMAMNVGYGSFLSGVLTASILVLGHTLNIILGPLAVLVHGVRLNVLEFCNHLDIKWKGLLYRPLREER